MKLELTLNGGLRIEPESDLEWDVLRCIGYDAVTHDLARQLGDGFDDPDGDWHEFVLPELSDGFSGQLQHVREAIEQAVDGSGRLDILPEQADAWYGALNQARFAIEERYHFALGELRPDDSPDRRSAYYRAQFYLDLQQLLLERVMR
ncbi:MAG TPA: hypothetical protein VIM46_02120 [Luteolibacter sp.]